MNDNLIIRLDHVSAGYGTKTVFEDVSLCINANDYVGVVGPNGGGKTTLVRLFLGLIKPQSGTITFWRDGNRVGNLSMGYLPQYSTIDKSFPISVEEVVLSGLNQDSKWHGKYTEQQRLTAEDTLKSLGIYDLRNSHIGTLSGGQMQRVLLGRAIVSKPEVIILDEPNTYVDKPLQQQMYDILRSINQQCIVILVSHDIKTVFQNARTAILVNHDVMIKPVKDLQHVDLDHCFNIL